ncbi:COQ9 family protein [Alphaproteobacteria bacterium]|nr:COQ9 family protein [Alphaproteobacteria bacterium]
MKNIDKKTKTKLLLSFLENVPFDGWSWETLYFSAIDNGLIKSKKLSEIEKDNLRNLFNNSLINIIQEFNIYLDNEMKESFKKSKSKNLRIPDKVKSQIILRLQAANKFKEAVRISLGMIALPKNAKIALNMLYKTCDIIWRDCGDKSTDFSFYTKRLILSGVYSSTLSYWLNESDFTKVEDFLQRRLDNVSNFGKIKKLPNLINQSNPLNTFFKILRKFNSNKFSYKPND